MRKLAVGYFLCMANSSVFVTLGQTFYLALATYPVSVILRAVGWRELSRTERSAGRVAPIVGVLGALTYSIVIGALVTEGPGADQPILLFAAVPWTIYSLVESAHYLRLGRFSRIPTFYIAAVNVPAVLYFSGIAMGMIYRVQLPEVPGEISSVMLFVMGGLLIFSGLMAGISFLLYRPVSRMWGASSVPYAPIRSRTELEGRVKTAGRALRGAGAVTTRPASQVHRVRVEVVAMGTSIVCSRCGKESPLTSSSCASCGTPFLKVPYGLRCPACSAPLKIAKRVSAERFVCTQCFSDLKVHLES